MSDSIFSQSSWRTTALGSAIELHSSHELQNQAYLHPVVVIGGVHGDEPEGVQLARETLRWLRERLPSAAGVCPWVLIPCLNVDGFAKNTRVNGRGVDLNRNYPSSDWSSEARAERYYPGPHAASEPEVQAMVDLIRITKPRLLIHCHSWSPCIVGTGESAARDSKRLSSSSGYVYQNEIGYPTPGSLSSYGWHDLRIPVICIEEQEGLADLSTVWPRFERGMHDIFRDLTLRESSSAWAT